ncbi:MAG: endolytic transglycosylase MltG [Candidatus Pacebacteria bacterium]|nr:endolytic transglycosylase MltG [Candidatus Paceibacterota bacterium]
MKIFKILLVLLAIIAIPFLFSYQKPSTFQEKIIIIEKGETAFNIASKLKNQEIINNSYSFLVTAFLNNNLKNLQAGEYSLNSNMNNNEIIEILSKGKTIKNRITIPEGWNNKEIAEYLEEKSLFKKQDVLDLINSNTLKIEEDNPPTLEGYLFPDTYLLEKNETLENTIKIILENFNKKLTSELKEDIKKQNKTIFEIITMASLIEKEVINYEDKQIVSGILWKRIEAKMPLQVDASIMYILSEKKQNISIKDTKIDSPYNTYKYRGLPKGPICNPGIESIKAAIYPIKTNYWYYLSKPTKETVFSKTLEEHNINKNKYLK